MVFISIHTKFSSRLFTSNFLLISITILHPSFERETYTLLVSVQDDIARSFCPSWQHVIPLSIFQCFSHIKINVFPSLSRTFCKKVNSHLQLVYNNSLITSLIHFQLSNFMFSSQLLLAVDISLKIREVTNGLSAKPSIRLAFTLLSLRKSMTIRHANTLKLVI